MRTSVVALLLALSACVELPRKPQRGTDRPLRIATWNLEHLAERNGEGCRPRAEADYATLRRHVTELNADVIRFRRSRAKLQPSACFRAMPGRS